MREKEDNTEKLGSNQLTFTRYLTDKQFTPTTINTYTNTVNRFETWLVNEKIEIEQVGYNDLTGYVKQLKTRGNTQRTIKSEIGTLKHYFNYHSVIGTIKKSVINHLEIQGVKRQKLHTILSLEELEYLYQNYPLALLKKTKGRKPQAVIQKRNKVIIGLLIYQGLSTTDLKQIKLEHVKLEKGEIKIEGTKRSNGRILKLEPSQILALQHFILVERQTLLVKHQKETDYLIFSVQGKNIHNLLSSLVKKMQQLLEKVVSLNQIRTSVITHWLKRYNLRETQYRAGHRYVSSTEAYKINDMDSLQNDINQFSPSL